MASEQDATLNDDHKHKSNGASFLSRDEFVKGAKLYIDSNPNSTSHLDLQTVGKHLYSRGWRWEEGRFPPFTQHMTRTGILTDLMPKTNDDIDEEEAAADPLNEIFICEQADESSTEIQSSLPNIIQVHQTIAFSSTWNVPVMYIEASKNDGSIISISDLLRSKVFHLSSIPPYEDVKSNEHATFPTISIGENPANGRGCVYLHPCQTAKSMGDLLNTDTTTSSSPPLEYLETFIMLCSEVVEMRLE